MLAVHESDRFASSMQPDMSMRGEGGTLATLP